jgi:integrase
MSDTHSTARPPRSKPAKPNPAFPLFPHAAGVWAKKIRGKLHYFGPWEDPEGALTKYEQQKEALHAGRKPRSDSDALPVKEMVNLFLIEKEERVKQGELSARTWTDYKEATDLLIKEFGKQRVVSDLGPDDFTLLRRKMAKNWGPHRLGKTIQCVRCVFRYAYDADLIDRPVRYGPGFDRPSQKTMRLHKAKQVVRLFTAEEVRHMVNGTLIVGEQGPKLARAGVQLRAMILLGINCGFGNSDCGQLPLSALDLDGGWINFPRPKTGIPRRCPLWQETIAALKEVLAVRKEPKDKAHARLVFVTKYGESWAKDIADSPITKETRKLLDELGINGHRNFYVLRHTHRTVSDGAKDQPAADHIMGHEPAHMSTTYREAIADERLKAVSDHVWAWLFALLKNKK